MCYCIWDIQQVHFRLIILTYYARGHMMAEFSKIVFPRTFNMHLSTSEIAEMAFCWTINHQEKSMIDLGYILGLVHNEFKVKRGSRQGI